VEKFITVSQASRSFLLGKEANTKAVMPYGGWSVDELGFQDHSFRMTKMGRMTVIGRMTLKGRVIKMGRGLKNLQ
jgi:hypothetical protein